MEPGVVGRFAPTPSGRLHLGNLFCALLAWLSARSAGGRMVLRIEDLDPARSRKEYADRLEQDLRFLGLDWDEGGSRGGPHPPYYQQECTQRYAALLDRLGAQGLVYPCFCTRAELHAADAPHAADGEPVYDGRCRGLSPAEAEERSRVRAPALRLRVPEETIAFTDGHYGPVRQFLPSECGDFILRRSDGVFAYQLAVVADDAAMEITQVVRGRDLLLSTPRQLLLYRLLGLTPPRFFHTPLLLAPDGRRLSKRDRDLDLGELRARFGTPEALLGWLAGQTGIAPDTTPRSAERLVEHFSWDVIRAHRENITVTAE